MKWRRTFLFNNQTPSISSEKWKNGWIINVGRVEHLFSLGNGNAVKSWVIVGEDEWDQHINITIMPCALKHYFQKQKINYNIDFKSYKLYFFSLWAFRTCIPSAVKFSLNQKQWPQAIVRIWKSLSCSYYFVLTWASIAHLIMTTIISPVRISILSLLQCNWWSKYPSFWCYF